VGDIGIRRRFVYPYGAVVFHRRHSSLQLGHGSARLSRRPHDVVEHHSPSIEEPALISIPVVRQSFIRRRSTAPPGRQICDMHTQVRGCAEHPRPLTACH